MFGKSLWAANDDNEISLRMLSNINQLPIPLYFSKYLIISCQEYLSKDRSLHN